MMDKFPPLRLILKEGVSTNCFTTIKAISVFLCMEMDKITQSDHPTNTSTPNLTHDPGHDECQGQTAKDGRSRTWMILTYEDNDQLQNVLDALAEHDFQYAGRVHDNEGKIHHHIVLVFKDGRKRKDIAEDLGIDLRWLRAWDRKKKALRYLCHRDNPERYQYTTDCIYGPLADEAVKACNVGDDISEADAVHRLIEIVYHTDEPLSYGVFMMKCCEAGIWSQVRRMGIFAVNLLKEHNECFRVKPPSA